MAYEIEKISEGNVDTPLTNFPVGEDTFPRMSDVSVTLLPLVLQYNNYYQNGQLSLAQQLLLENPELDACLHNADKWNMIRDAIIAMQRFLLNQVDSLYNEVAQNAIGVNDEPTEEQASIVAYSAAKVDSLIDSHINAENPHNITNVPTADSAIKLATSRTIRTNLASTATASFDGSKNVTPGVTGVLGVANGGTGNDSVDTVPTSESTKMVTSGGVYTALAEKQNTITGGLTTALTRNFSINRAIISNEEGKLASSSITSEELGYLDNVTSNIQTQLDDKWSMTTSRTKNTVLAAPNGNEGAPTFRALVAADIPSLAASKISAGTLAGKVIANATSVVTLSDKQVRNIFSNTTAATAGSAFSGLSNGDIYLQYE